MKRIISLSALVLAFIAALSILIEKDTIKRNKTEKKPNDWFYMQRAFPYQQINQEAYFEAARQAWKMKQESFSLRESDPWELAGPLNIGGRISAVAMHSENTETIYVGAASGGIFKTTDQGDSWEAVFEDAMSLSIGDIEVAKSNDQVIYVGTGEANGGGGSISYDGVGMYKSTDGGQQWEYLGLENSGSIGRVVVHPDNTDIVYVAAMGRMWSNSPDRGVYKSTDGGQNWEQIFYLSDSTGAIDLVINPENPEILYTAMWERVRKPDMRHYGGATSGIYKTTNGGESWSELTDGLPTNPTKKGRIGIDLCQAEPNVLYAIYADKIGYFEGVYKSENHGESWEQTNDNSMSGNYASYGWWFGRIHVDPFDPDISFVIGFDLYRTSNGGNYWSNSSGNIHVDQHDLYIHPMETDFVVVGNDGGLYISENGGASWEHNELLPITQFYTCEIDESEPERLYGGTQDNGTIRTLSGDEDDWHRIYGGDGFRVLVDPNDNSYVYATYQYGGFGRSVDGGNFFYYGATDGISYNDRFNWSTPYVFNPLNSESLFIGSNKLYKTYNRARDWNNISGDLTNGAGEFNQTFGTITCIAVSAVDTNKIYVGTDDGNVWYSPNSGTEWIDVNNDLPNRWVTSIATDPFSENTVYITFSGYRYDSYLPHVLKTNDNGLNWEDISGNLPEAPVNKILVDPEVEDLLYLANDFGVYFSTDGGLEWDILGKELPNVPVVDLDFHMDDRFLIAATYGRSMYKIEVDEAVGIKKDLSESNINIYPNPFKNTISIDVSGIRKASVRIVDAAGRLMGVLNANGENNVIWDGRNMSGNEVNAGYYFAQILADNKMISVKKIIKVE